MGNCVRGLWLRYQTERLPYLRSKTCQEYRRIWEREILPELGERELSEIDRPCLLAWHQKRQAHPYQANRCLNVLAAALELAVKDGEIQKNPCRGLRRFQERPRVRYYTAEELLLLGDALRVLVYRGEVTQTSADALTLALLTGCRRNEVLALAWEPTDESSGWVSVFSKTIWLERGKTDGRVIPLCGAALELLTRRLETAGSSVWVFPGHRIGSHLQGVQKAWERARKLARVPNARVHDLRKTFGTGVLEVDGDIGAAGRLLGQSDPKTTAKSYAFYTTSKLRRTAESAGAFLAKAWGTA